MINGFESKKFPIKNTGVYHDDDDDDDDDDDFAYGDDLDSGRTLMQDSSTTLPIILHPPLRGSTQGRGIRILPIKQILQRLLILLAQLKAGNAFKNSLSEVWQIVYSLYQVKEISKKYSIIYLNKYGDECNIYCFIPLIQTG